MIYENGILSWKEWLEVKAKGYTSVSGNFYCDHAELESLVGAPESVGGDFYCDHAELKSLVGAPESVGGGFLCYSNKLKSLDGAPKTVGGDFYCDEDVDINSFDLLKFNIKRVGI